MKLVEENNRGQTGNKRGKLRKQVTKEKLNKWGYIKLKNSAQQWNQ